DAALFALGLVGADRVPAHHGGRHRRQAIATSPAPRAGREARDARAGDAHRVRMHAVESRQTPDRSPGGAAEQNRRASRTACRDACTAGRRVTAVLFFAAVPAPFLYSGVVGQHHPGMLAGSVRDGAEIRALLDRADPVRDWAGLAGLPGGGPRPCEGVWALG